MALLLSARSAFSIFMTYKPVEPTASSVTEDIGISFALSRAICSREKKYEIQCESNRCRPFFLRVFPVATAEKLRYPSVDIFEIALYSIAERSSADKSWHFERQGFGGEATVYASRRRKPRGKDTRHLKGEATR